MNELEESMTFTDSKSMPIDYVWEKDYNNLRVK